MNKVTFDETGNSLVHYVGQRAALPGVVGNLAEKTYQVVPTPYSIKDGKIVTMVGNTPFAMTLYKLGDKYYGARSNEFGYANYEILAKGPKNLVKLAQGRVRQGEPGRVPAHAGRDEMSRPDSVRTLCLC